jgi:hypothetical protein
LYGGIHFRDAIENGVKEGEQIGQLFIARFSDNHSINENNKTSFSAQLKK